MQGIEARRLSRGGSADHRALLPGVQLHPPWGLVPSWEPRELRLSSPCPRSPGPRSPGSSCGQRVGVRPPVHNLSCRGLSDCRQVHH